MRTLEEIKGNLSSEMFSLLLSSSPKFWCEKVMGKDVQPFHEEWLKLINSNQRIAIEAFTGSGKTEMIICYTLWYLFNHRDSEVLIVSSTMRQSTSVLDRFIKAIEENELLRSMVNSKNVESGSWYSRSASGAQVCLTEYRKVFCAPYGPSLRGYHVNIVIGDEVAVYRDKGIWVNYLATRVNSRTKFGKVIAISTPVSPTDLMQDLMNNPEYVRVVTPIKSKDGVLAWEDRFNDEFIRKRKVEMGIGNFEREYMCNPNAQVEGAIFETVDIVECTKVDLSYYNGIKGETFIGADFAVSNGVRADYDVYFVGDKYGGKINLIDAFRAKGVPKEEKVRILKEMNEKYHPLQCLVDISGIGKAVADDLFGLGVPVVEVNFQKPTERRALITNLITVIQGKKLSIPYKNNDDGMLELSMKLVEELLEFREINTTKTGERLEITQYKSVGAHDDTVWALAMCCKGASDMMETTLFSNGV